MKNENLKTILTVTFAHEAIAAKGRLEAEGIFCFLKDELTVQILPFHSNAVGGIKLQVREDDFDRAMEILKESDYANEEEPPSLEEKEQRYNEKFFTEKGEKTCPFCGSDEVFRVKKLGWIFVLVSLLVTEPSPFFQKRYYCFDCKQKFKLKS